MKNYLLILSSLGLSCLTATSVVACGPNSGSNTEIDSASKVDISKVIVNTSFEFALAWNENEGQSNTTRLWAEITKQNPLITNSIGYILTINDDKNVYSAILSTTEESNLYTGQVDLTWSYTPYIPIAAPTTFAIKAHCFIAPGVDDEKKTKEAFVEANLKSEFNEEYFHFSNFEVNSDADEFTACYEFITPGGVYSASGEGKIQGTFKSTKQVDVSTIPKAGEVSNLSIVDDSSYAALIAEKDLNPDEFTVSAKVTIDSPKQFIITAKNDTGHYGTLTIKTSGDISLAALGIADEQILDYWPSDEVLNSKIKIKIIDKIRESEGLPFKNLLDPNNDNVQSSFTVTLENASNIRNYKFIFNGAPGYTGSVSFMLSSANLSPIAKVQSKFPGLISSSNNGYLASSIDTSNEATIESVIEKITLILGSEAFEIYREEANDDFISFNGINDTIYEGLVFTIDNDFK